MLIEFAHRGIRPDLILFADTGGEKPETYQYLVWRQGRCCSTPAALCGR
jgi:hypothetical protein